MLENLLIFSFCIVAITANGEFTVLNSPKSLSFKGNEPLQSKYLGDVAYAALGNAVPGDAQWSGMTIDDPFNMPKKAIVIALSGVANSKLSGTGKTYQLQGNSVAQALNGVSAQLEADNEPVCAINFEDFEEGLENFSNIAGDVKLAPVAGTKYLSAELHSADKQYLQSIARLRYLAENLGRWQKTCDFVVIYLSVDSVAKAHGEKSEAVAEAMDLFTNVCKLFTAAAQKTTNSESLVLAVVNKADSLRTKREALGPDPKNPYNLAEYYSEDYPVIFNIILWFMVTFGFALLAICYAIGSMDPGRDSIIYRMTSTRMKKDN